MWTKPSEPGIMGWDKIRGNQIPQFAQNNQPNLVPQSINVGYMNYITLYKLDVEYFFDKDFHRLLNQYVIWFPLQFQYDESDQNKIE